MRIVDGRAAAASSPYHGGDLITRLILPSVPSPMQVDDLAIWMVMRNRRRDRPKGSRCDIPLSLISKIASTNLTWRRRAPASSMRRRLPRRRGCFRASCSGSRGTCCARRRPHRSSEAGHDAGSSRNMDDEAPPSVSVECQDESHTGCPDASARRDAASGGATFWPMADVLNRKYWKRFGTSSVKLL